MFDKLFQAYLRLKQRIAAAESRYYNEEKTKRVIPGQTSQRYYDTLAPDTDIHITVRNASGGFVIEVFRYNEKEAVHKCTQRHIVPDGGNVADTMAVILVTERMDKI